MQPGTSAHTNEQKADQIEKQWDQIEGATKLIPILKS